MEGRQVGRSRPSTPPGSSPRCIDSAGATLTSVHVVLSLPVRLESQHPSFVPLEAALRPPHRRCATSACHGDVDGQAKNLPFFFSPAGLPLAPAYDLLCGLIYENERVENTPAMAAYRKPGIRSSHAFGSREVGDGAAEIGAPAS